MDQARDREADAPMQAGLKQRRSSSWLWRWAMILLASCGFAAAEPLEIRVGAYDFPPYVSVDTQQTIGGMLPDLLALLNAHQQEVVFRAVPLAAKRRYSDFEARRYEAIFFKMPSWGWEGQRFEPSRVYLEDDEIYVALAAPDRDQRFFDALQERNLVGILGYHYGFAAFNSDEDYLSRHFSIMLSTSHEQNLKVLLLGRSDIAEVAIMPRAYLNWFVHRHPDATPQLLIADRPDQVYRLRTLIHPDAGLDPERLNRWLDELDTRGQLETIWRRHHWLPQRSAP